MTEQTMKAAVLDRYGDVDELKIREVPVPLIGDADVLIRIEAAGAGSWDAEERAGHYEGVFGVPTTFPYILGWDAAGTVAGVGGSVTDFRPGDRVYAATTPLPRGGFYAQYGVADAEFVAHVPERLSTEQAGALPWDALTALSSLDALEADEGSTVLIFGASGGIGHLALQLAKHRGLRVLAVASGADGVDLAARLGADAVVDGRRHDVAEAAAAFAPAGIDSAIVTAGGDVAERSLRTLKAGGRVAWPNGVFPDPPASSNVDIIRTDGARGRATTDRLNSIIESGGLEVHIGARFDLEDAADAHRALERHYVGKLLLLMSR